jgi:hypothetical protein
VFGESATYIDHIDYVMESSPVELKSLNATWADYTFNDIRVIEQDENGQFVERFAQDSNYLTFDNTLITAKRDGAVRVIMFKNSYLGNDDYTHIVGDVYLDNATGKVFNAYSKYKRYSADIIIKSNSRILTLLNITKMFNEKFNVQFNDVVSDNRIIKLKTDGNYYLALNESEDMNALKRLPNSIYSLYCDYLNIWWELNGETLYVGIENENDDIRNLYRNLIIDE